MLVDHPNGYVKKSLEPTSNETFLFSAIDPLASLICKSMKRKIDQLEKVAGQYQYDHQKVTDRSYPCAGKSIQTMCGSQDKRVGCETEMPIKSKKNAKFILLIVYFPAQVLMETRVGV